jgi:hypothetical protein
MGKYEIEEVLKGKYDINCIYYYKNFKKELFVKAISIIWNISQIAI